MVGRRSDDWERPTKPDATREHDPYFRLGALMRDVAELRERVEELERLNDERVRPRPSIRPTVERIGTSAVVAGIVAGIVQALERMLSR